MKVLFSVLTLLLTASAQSQVQLGAFAGPQITDVRYIINNEKQKSSIKAGINAGFQFKIPFENRLSFAPSIMYNLRGYNVKFKHPSYPPDSMAVDNNTSFHTIELAFLLQHDFQVEPGHIFLRFGPSLDFALFGNEKFNTKSGSAVDQKMKFSFSEYGHYLASAIIQLGFEAPNGMFFYGYYNYSLTTMNNADNGPAIGNRAAGISVGMYINRNWLKVQPDSGH